MCQFLPLLTLPILFLYMKPKKKYYPGICLNKQRNRRKRKIKYLLPSLFCFWFQFSPKGRASPFQSRFPPPRAFKWFLLCVFSSGPYMFNRL